MIFYDECHTNIGRLRFIFKEDGLLKRIVLTDGHWHDLASKYTMKWSDGLGKSVCLKLQEYIYGNYKQIDVPFELTGTPFQKQVWKALQSIPLWGNMLLF